MKKNGRSLSSHSSFMIPRPPASHVHLRSGGVPPPCARRSRKLAGGTPSLRYCAVCASAAAMSASLRNDITVTLRVRYDGSTTCILPSFS